MGPLIPQTAPVNTVAPIVTGAPNTANVGSTVSVTAGTWSPAPNLFPTTTPAVTYQWQQWEFSAPTSWHWASIPGATASSLTLTSALIGDNLRALVTASNRRT